jgi:hypothetical protein
MTQSVAFEKSAQELEGSERERVIRKIKRCLALGESSNQNEADMAMRQAQAMMRSYRLTEADVHANSVGCDERNTGLIRMADWQRGLANAAAKAFGCKMLMRRYMGGPVTFMFIGVMPAAELAAYAYDSLLGQIKAARKRFSDEHKATRRMADDFCLAWVYAVESKVVKFAQNNPVHGAQANALILVEQQEQSAINAWIARQHGEVKDRKQATREDYNMTAIKMGIKAGELANINQAVGAHGDTLVLAAT